MPTLHSDGSTACAVAIDSGQDAGVWGGMSEDERRAQAPHGRLRARAHERQAGPAYGPVRGPPQLHLVTNALGTVRGLRFVADGQSDHRRGAAAGSWRDPQPATQFADNQRANDLQAEARGVRVESVRKPSTIIGNCHGQPF